ncbi:hypothetical protein E2C01_003370 [Portunus trituberculatus]|uniref:Uncharacterized protein n=1 Tax=Portunus trituberculatus TaxID=210409 RepID=A0A5B7CPL2_PORTR|nr:hypothetical protein [Portunus trituberculatus]
MISYFSSTKRRSKLVPVTHSHFIQGYSPPFFTPGTSPALSPIGIHHDTHVTCHLSPPTRSNAPLVAASLSTNTQTSLRESLPAA